MVNFAGLLVILLTFALGKVNSTIVLITASNFSLPFPDIEASFAPQVPTLGILGVVFAADPSNACTPLQIKRPNEFSAFVLVERGDCDFVTKVKNVQDAGYTGAIISDSKDGQGLVTMAGSAEGIDIFAVFVSKQVGEVLQLCAGDMNCRCYLFPPFEHAARSAIAISFISILAFFAVSATFALVRRHHIHLATFGPVQRKPGGIPLKKVQALPVILFDSELNAPVETCAICLEECMTGEKLRLLPCDHYFHVACIDQWLTTWGRFCPVCKQDACSEQHLSCRITQFCGENNGISISSSHVSSTTLFSSNSCILPNNSLSNCSAFVGHSPSSAVSSTSNGGEDVVIHMTSVE